MLVSGVRDIVGDAGDHLLHFLILALLFPPHLHDLITLFFDHLHDMAQGRQRIRQGKLHGTLFFLDIFDLSFTGAHIAAQTQIQEGQEEKKDGNDNAVNDHDVPPR